MNRRIPLCLGAMFMAASLLGATASSFAAETPVQTYGVVSLIGEDMSLIGYSNGELGTRINRNRTNVVTIANAGFDAAALGAIERVVQQEDKGSKVILYRLKSARLTANPSLLYAFGKAALPPSYVQAMKEDGVTRVLLLSRFKRAAMFQLSEGEAQIGLGGGTVEGLGYYADGQTMIQNKATKYVGKGYLAPFVSLHMAVIDLGTSEVLASRAVFEAEALGADAAPEKGAENAWTIVPDTEKIPLLNRLITRALERSVPPLLKGASDGTALPQQ